MAMDSDFVVTSRRLVPAPVVYSARRFQIWHPGQCRRHGIRLARPMVVSEVHGTVRTASLTWIATAIVLSVMATLLVTQAWRVDAAPGDEESSFVPVTPCRLFDFRAGADNVGPRSTPLGQGESNVYTQRVRGANGNCVIPPDATAISMNVTIANPTSQSNLRVFPADVGTPTASNLNWLEGQSPTPNKVDVKLSSDGMIKLYNHAGSVDVLADVVGYYTNSALQDLASSVAGLESSLEAANAKIEEAEAKTTANELLIEQSLARVEVLEDAQPFTLHGTGSLPSISAPTCPNRRNLVKICRRSSRGHRECACQRIRPGRQYGRGSRSLCDYDWHIRCEFGHPDSRIADSVGQLPRTRGSHVVLGRGRHHDRVQAALLRAEWVDLDRWSFHDCHLHSGALNAGACTLLRRSNIARFPNERR